MREKFPTGGLERRKDTGGRRSWKRLVLKNLDGAKKRIKRLEEREEKGEEHQKEKEGGGSFPWTLREGRNTP